MDFYPAKYSDKNGTEVTIIRNDGKILRMDVRGVEFSGSDFESLHSDENTAVNELSLFTFNEYDQLGNFQLECEIPVKILENEIESVAVLNVLIEYKIKPHPITGEVSKLLLTLKHKDNEFQSSMDWGNFEDTFGEIESKLRNFSHKLRLKCCFGCKLSDYSVYGHSMFGDLICFKNHKEKFLSVKNQYDFYDLLEESLEYVQETHLCSEFQTRYPLANDLTKYVD